MGLPFLNRVDELRRLSSALESRAPVLVVIYGRRRCGKSTLLQQVLRPGDVYFLADEREAPLQIHALAEAIDAVIPGFSTARYPSWGSLISTLSERLDRRLSLFVDEFPYLVRQAPELTSLIQREIDRPGPKKLNWVLCGSSQRMMQGMVLDRTAPLFGRAREAIQVRPLGAGWVGEALKLTSPESIRSYAVWGGIPRYWELATEFKNTRDAVRDLVLDRNGVLHGEHLRLLLEDMRSAVQAYSILFLIGSGCHRVSEIAARVNKPAGSLTRPLANLVELGLVRREIPWGDDERSSKKSLYRLRDPFLQFHTTFVQPYQGLLELGRTEAVMKQFDSRFEVHVGGVWEDLVRESVSGCRVGGIEWGPASRWWGAGVDGRPLELDLVAESLDGRSLLVGEAKWSATGRDTHQLASDLNARVARFPHAQKRTVVQALWLQTARGRHPTTLVQSPGDVLSRLK